MLQSHTDTATQFAAPVTPPPPHTQSGMNEAHEKAALTYLAVLE